VPPARVRSKRHPDLAQTKEGGELSSKEAFRLGGVRTTASSHSIRPGLFSKLYGTLARRRQLGSASSSNELYTFRWILQHPCQAWTSNPSATAKFHRRARTLTIFPCSAKPMHILPYQRFSGLQDVRLREQADEWHS
jgi:hypothetical protein